MNHSVWCHGNISPVVSRTAVPDHVGWFLFQDPTLLNKHWSLCKISLAKLSLRTGRLPKICLWIHKCTFYVELIFKGINEIWSDLAVMMRQEQARCCHRFCLYAKLSQLAAAQQLHRREANKMMIICMRKLPVCSGQRVWNHGLFERGSSSSVSSCNFSRILQQFCVNKLVQTQPCK